MKRCWLHIGMHKTGSSSIQKNLGSIRQPDGWKLLKIGGRANMGPVLHAMFDKNPHKCHWFASKGDSPERLAKLGAKWRSQLTRTVERSTAADFVISAEALSLFSKQGTRNLAQFLKPLFDEVRVIGYVRPPAGFITSRFQQNVKLGHGRFDLSRVTPNYRQRFEKYDDAFGRDMVTLRRFDPAVFPGKCIVCDFARETGIRLPDGHEIQRYNESLSREACGMLYAYRKFGGGYGVGRNAFRENSYLINALLSLQGPKFGISTKLIDEVLESQQGDIEWMERRLGESLSETLREDDMHIASEDDLLSIRRTSCEEFVTALETILARPIPREAIPSDDPVAPEQVAILMKSCREVCGKAIFYEKGMLYVWFRRMRKVPRILFSPLLHLLGGKNR